MQVVKSTKSDVVTKGIQTIWDYAGVGIHLYPYNMEIHLVLFSRHGIKMLAEGCDSRDDKRLIKNLFTHRRALEISSSLAPEHRVFIVDNGYGFTIVRYKEETKRTYIEDFSEFDYKNYRQVFSYAINNMSAVAYPNAMRLAEITHENIVFAEQPESYLLLTSKKDAESKLSQTQKFPRKKPHASANAGTKAKNP